MIGKHGRKKVTVLGSTGSIGTQTLSVIEENPDCFEVSVLTCGKRAELLSEQIEKFKPALAVTASEADAFSLSKRHPKTEFAYGTEGLFEAACADADIAVNALVGIKGLMPTYKAALLGHTIAFANKETLVAGGRRIMDAVKTGKGRLLPVDSEHSAIFQCLQGNPGVEGVKRLILTASGGPFRGYTLDALSQVTLEKALRHPNWTMGSKITIDSATMMNKGLEIIEAKWLFDMPETQIDVLIHPQSVVHSMVEYWDGCVLAQMGRPDMKAPIRFALGYPKRLETQDEPLNFLGEGASLTFEKPDMEVFACLKLARESIREEDSSYPVVLNAANEILVQLFLEKKIKFLDIQNNIERMLERHQPERNPEIERILEIDEATRRETLAQVRQRG